MKDDNRRQQVILSIRVTVVGDGAALNRLYARRKSFLYVPSRSALARYIASASVSDLTCHGSRQTLSLC